MNENIRQQLLQAAVLAPSADNRVPYFLDWQANGDLLVCLNQERCGSVQTLNLLYLIRRPVELPPDSRVLSLPMV